MDLDNATEKIWAESVRAKTVEVMNMVATHAKNVKMKLTQVVKEHETTSEPVVAAQVAQAGDSDRKKDLAIKMKMKSARFVKRAKDPITKDYNLHRPPYISEKDIRREISVEFPERDKECKEVGDGLNDALENLATVDEALRDLAEETRIRNHVDEMSQGVLERKVLVRSRDQVLGLCTEYPNQANGKVPAPDIFDGKIGRNVFKFKEKVEEYIEAAQIREKDKVDTLRKYLSGEAKQRVGDHHKNLKSALQCLTDNYGNPRAIWTESKKDLLKAVGNYRKDKIELHWGQNPLICLLLLCCVIVIFIVD